MSSMPLARNFTGTPAAAECGQPIDSQYFDVADFAEASGSGAAVTLARFQLPAQYCGHLEYFAQFTDAHAKDPSRVRTPGLHWQIRANGEPLSPYHAMEAILNPWGNGSFQFRIRLPERAVVELVVSGKSPDVTLVGGRLMGRYWYNAANGGAR